MPFNCSKRLTEACKCQTYNKAGFQGLGLYVSLLNRLSRHLISLEIFIMTDTVFNPAVQPIPIPVRELLPWIIFGGLILLLALYFVGAEQGATSLIPGMYVHEFVHDSRHLLGFPCH